MTRVNVFWISEAVVILLRCVAGQSLDYEEIDDDRSFLNEQDFKLAQFLPLSELYTNKEETVLPQPNKYRGDIVGKAALVNRLTVRRKNLRRNGVRMTFDKWPGSKIPYVISQRYNRKERAILARAFQTYHDRTCVRFVPHSNERDYLYIGKIDGCFSDVGRAGGRQEVSLDDGCMQYDTAAHELMHAVGFWHEHERSDRDEFITIVWQNIDRDAYDQFGKVNLFESDYYGESYDYFSIMHYDSRSFSKNGRSTIEAKQPGMTYVIGKVKDFSAIDLRKINKMYNCPNNYFNNNYNVHHSPPRSLTQQPSFHHQQSTVEQQRISPQPPSTHPFVFSSPETRLACRDKGTLCHLWIARCRAPDFKWLLKSFCQFTCGYCDEALEPVENTIYRSPFG